MDGGAPNISGVRVAPAQAARAFDAADYRDCSAFLVLPGSDRAWIEGLSAYAARDTFGERRIVVVGEDPFERDPAAVRKRCVWILAGFSDRAARALAAGVSDVAFDADTFPRTDLPDDLAMRIAIRTFEDVERYGRLLAAMFSLSSELSIGVRELLVNAVEHGNLEIRGDQKTLLLNDGTYFDEVLRRIDSDRYVDRYALLHVHCKDRRLRFRIVDCGDGFDWRAVVGREIVASECRHSRGIALAEAAGFSAFRYIGKGNEVSVEIELGP